SARVLEPGDLIVAAEGVELRGPNCWVRFKALINSCEPGERIELTVRRGAAPRFRAQVTLGSYRELLRQGPGAADLNPRDLARAWKARQARLGLRPGPAPLDPGVDAAQWLRGELEAAQGASTAMARRGDRGVYRRAVYAGGEPRAWPEDPDELNQFMATQGKFEGQIPQVQLQLMNEAADEVRAAMPIEEEIRTLERALDYFRQVRDGPVAQPGPAGPAAAPNLDRVALLEKELAAVRAEAGLGPESDAARPDAGGAP
ncbi:MAG TPA: hypothetical protein VD963_00255, partial [Phycisphaerales bacterium]|nr:hypothetical protein [Phycisphaerales bacterium]